jgi:hypothetical protein
MENTTVVEAVIDNDPREPSKEITDLNLRALSDDFAALLSEHLGGTFKVDLTRYVQVENKGSGLSGYGGEIDVEFRVTDESRFSRPRWTAAFAKYTTE